MLQIQQLTIRFRSLTVIDGMNLSIGAGETVGLVGPNGAGKTTLFNSISGLVQPASGTMRFGAANLARIPLYRRARMGIGRTFQVPQPLHGLTVRKNLLVAQRFGSGTVEERKVDDILDLLNLAGHAECDAATGLTLTQLKALEVGKALATNPKLLLLDEVLAGLETHAKREFANMLDAIRQRYGLAMLIIEHDIETIKSLCPRVCVLNFGKLIADGDPDKVFRDPAVIESYTGGEDA